LEGFNALPLGKVLLQKIKNLLNFNMLKAVFNKFHEFNASRELKRYTHQIAAASSNLSARELVDFVFGEKWSRFFWIKQEFSEILSLCNLLEKVKPKVVLEIGTAQGGSLFLFSKLADPNALIISIDLPEGKFGGGYKSYKTDFFKSFASTNQTIHLLRADSHSFETYDRVKKILNGRKIDFLFIDGDHTYDGVQRDFDQYSKLVDENGLIGFHDIVSTTDECEVKRFWNETKMRYRRTTEFVNDPNQRFCGIGLLSLKDSVVRQQ